MADSAEAPEGEEGNQGISLKALSLEQLRQIKDGLAEEVDGLKGAVQQLKTSSDKLVISKMSLDQLEKTEDGTRMLVPMTSSLYVNGETTPLQNVLVDVGTGYYIEKSAAEAQAFFDRKIELIKNQGMSVQKAMALKNQHFQQTVAAINDKLYEAQAAQQKPA